MASGAVGTELNSTPEPEWNDSAILSSLDRLQEVHIQLRRLRDTVPRILKPLLVWQPTPDALHMEFSQAATETVKDLKDFTRILESERTRELLGSAKESRTGNPESIAGWMATEHEDWLDLRREDSLSVSVSEETETLPIEIEYNEEIARKILSNFQNSHIGIEASFINENFRSIKLNLPAPANIEFEIEVKTDYKGSIPFIVTCKGNSNLHTAILDTVVARAKPNDLVYLLEMLASYIDIKSSACFKCRRLLDPNAQLPVMRLQEKTKLADGESSTLWQALHKGCS